MIRKFSQVAVFVLFAGTLSASSAHAQGVSPWTRVSAMKQIDQVSLRLLAETEKITYAEAQSLEADGYWWPQGKAYGNVGMGPGYKGAPLNGYSDGDDIGPILRGGLEAGILLTGFGQVFALKALAKQGIDVAQAEVDVMRHVVRTELDGALVDAEVAASRTSQLKRDGTWIQKIEEVANSSTPAEVEENTAERMVLLRSEHEMATVQGETALKQTRRRVLTLLADPEGRLALNPVSAPMTATEWLPLEECLEVAQQHRPFLVYGRKLLTAGELNLFFQKMRFLPGIGVVAGATRRYAPADTNQLGAFKKDPRNGGGLNAVLAAEWQLDFPDRWKEIAKANGQVGAGKELLEFYMAEGLYEVYVDYTVARKSEERLMGYRASTVAAEEWLAGQFSRFQAGEGSLTLLLEAFNAQRKSMAEYAQMTGEFHKALSRLRAGAGRVCWR